MKCMQLRMPCTCRAPLSGLGFHHCDLEQYRRLQNHRKVATPWHPAHSSFRAACVSHRIGGSSLHKIEPTTDEIGL